MIEEDLKTKEAYILKLSYRMQELEFGGLSSASRSFLSKISAKAPNVKKVAIAPIGTKIIKQYKGRDYVIRVLENGYDLDGQRFKSLSGMAKKITGMKISGSAFFGFNLRGK